MKREPKMGTNDQAAPSSFLDGTLKRLQQTSSCDTNNLINKTVPFGKHPGPSDREMLDSYWYCKTYDEWISDPQTEFLFPIEVYVDRMGKTAGLQSYCCGEPMTWSTPLLNQSIRQSDEVWRAMGYIPDLKVSSSAKKKKANGANTTKGQSL
jgi:hypothetical protein